MADAFVRTGVVVYELDRNVQQFRHTRHTAHEYAGHRDYGDTQLFERSRAASRSIVEISDIERGIMMMFALRWHPRIFTDLRMYDLDAGYNQNIRSQW